MTDYPETLFVPSHSLVGRLGLIRPPDNPDLIKDTARYCTFNKRWWAGSAAEAMDKMDTWIGFTGLREPTPEDLDEWREMWQ